MKLNRVKPQTPCPYCGSSLSVRKGRHHCMGDNLRETQSQFDYVISIENNALLFEESYKVIAITEESADLFATYYQMKKLDSEYQLECPHDANIRQEVDLALLSIDPRLPIGSAKISIPDPAQVHISEKMLGRKLTDGERFQDTFVPTIDKDGQPTYTLLKYVIYPQDVSTEYKDMYDKTNYDKSEIYFEWDMLPEMFEWIRGNRRDQ